MKSKLGVSNDPSTHHFPGITTFELGENISLLLLLFLKFAAAAACRSKGSKLYIYPLTYRKRKRFPQGKRAPASGSASIIVATFSLGYLSVNAIYISPSLSKHVTSANALDLI